MHRGVGAMLEAASQKALFDYWHDRVRLKNLPRIGAQEHVPTQVLRHQCTNYDELRHLKAVQDLDELERCRVIAIIKYECTARVLQRRTGLLRDIARQCEANSLTQQKERSRLGALLQKLKQALRGQQIKIDRLQARLQALEAENAALRSEQQQSKAELQLQKELVALQRALEATEERRRQLARNNQSLGGRVAHSDRYRRQRDELQEALRAEQQTNRQLRGELERLRTGEQLGLGLAE
jgi:chromosome segregation ATPase